MSTQPQAVLVSAGFDTHVRDPLGSMQVTESGYGHMALRCLELAQRHAEGRLALALEGGYNLPALGRSVEATLRALADEQAPDVGGVDGPGAGHGRTGHGRAAPVLAHLSSNTVGGEAADAASAASPPAAFSTPCCLPARDLGRCGR